MTRFCPNINGRIHVGHLWTAKVNAVFAHTKKLLLRFEDITTQHSTTTSREDMLANAADFEANMERFEIPIRETIWQSQREPIYDIANRTLFAGRLTWDDLMWASRCVHYGNPGMGWAGSSSWMAQLSRVIDDHDYGIRSVIRGTELCAEREAYWFIYDQVYPDVPDMDKPSLVFIPEVMESHDHKISKSVSRGFFLSDIKARPEIILASLILHQMDLPCGWTAEALHRERNMTMLDQIIKTGQLKRDPEPLLPETVRQWEEDSRCSA